MYAFKDNDDEFARKLDLLIKETLQDCQIDITISFNGNDGEEHEAEATLYSDDIKNKEVVKDIVRNYLLEHPEVVVPNVEYEDPRVTDL